MQFQEFCTSLKCISDLILSCLRISVLETTSRPLLQFKAISMVKLMKVVEICNNEFFSSQTTLLYCPSSIDLQTLAEEFSPISHQFDVISPSHIWIFAHVTQGQDPWIISLSSFLKQENLPEISLSHSCELCLDVCLHKASVVILTS